MAKWNISIFMGVNTQAETQQHGEYCTVIHAWPLIPCTERFLKKSCGKFIVDQEFLAAKTAFVWGILTCFANNMSQIICTDLHVPIYSVCFYYFV